MRQSVFLGHWLIVETNCIRFRGRAMLSVNPRKNMFIEDQVPRHVYSFGFNVIDFPTLLTMWVAWENTFMGPLVKLISSPRVIVSITQRSKYLQMLIGWFNAKEHFIWSCRPKNLCGCSVNEICGSEDAFTPKFDGKLSLESQCLGNI